MNRPRSLTPLMVVLFAGVIASFGGSDDAQPPSNDTVAATGTSVTGGPEVTGGEVPPGSRSAPGTDSPVVTAEPEASAPIESGRVVSLGEEFVLADLLALGVTPVASTATVPEAGFQGLDQFDTSGIEILPVTELNLEQVAALRPDVIVTTQFIADEAGPDILASLAEVVVLPDDATAEERLLAMAERFGSAEAADQLISELDVARAGLRAEVEKRSAPCDVSVATIYPGPSVAAWVDATTDIPRAVVDAGCRLAPTPDDGAPDQNGRLFVSLEQLTLLDAPTLLLLQSDTVDGENEAVDALADDPLWSQVPAVASGDVITLDRLGYPGVPGQLALVTDLTDLLAG